MIYLLCLVFLMLCTCIIIYKLIINKLNNVSNSICYIMLTLLPILFLGIPVLFIYIMSKIPITSYTLIMAIPLVVFYLEIIAIPSIFIYKINKFKEVSIINNCQDYTKVYSDYTYELLKYSRYVGLLYIIPIILSVFVLIFSLISIFTSVLATIIIFPSMAFLAIAPLSVIYSIGILGTALFLVIVILTSTNAIFRLSYIQKWGTGHRIINLFLMFIPIANIIVICNLCSNIKKNNI